VTLQWPPAPPEDPADGDVPVAEPTPIPTLGGMRDPRLIAGIAEITAMIATQLDDGASAASVMPVIRDATRRWLEQSVRSGLLPATAGGALDELAAAVHDRRYGLGPLSSYLRDRHVENVDINGCDQVWISYASGERVAGLPVAASDDALIDMVRTWATRGGQTARDFSATAPLVNVALAGGARLTATMSVTPRPCVSLRRHGQLDITLDRLTELGTVDETVAAFLAAAVRSRCNIIICGESTQGKPPCFARWPARSRRRSGSRRWNRSTSSTCTSWPSIRTSSPSRHGNRTRKGPVGSACVTSSPTRCGTIRGGSSSVRSGVTRSCRCSRQ
jgi:hypothetical protein